MLVCARARPLALSLSLSLFLLSDADCKFSYGKTICITTSTKVEFKSKKCYSIGKNEWEKKCMQQNREIYPSSM
jgi:hypothetical protein